MGLLIWGCTNMLTGWATGRFGWFVNPETLDYPALNGFGVLLVLVSLVLYTQIKSDITPALSHAARGSVLPSDAGCPDDDLTSVQEGLQGERKPLSRPVGIFLAMVSGVLYGSNFIPSTVMKENGWGPLEPLDYIFSHFCGSASLLCVAALAQVSIWPRLCVRGEGGGEVLGCCESLRSLG